MKSKICKIPKYSFLLIFFAFFLAFSAGALTAQVSRDERGMALKMLEMTKSEIKQNYYDPNFRGLDVDQTFDQARERLKTAPSRDALMMTIAAAVMAFDDSHTTFYPPDRAADIDYGWRMAMPGNNCYVSHVKPKSDAEAKGLRRGDRLLLIDGMRPTRETLWQLYYHYFTISPAASVTMTLLSPGATKPHVLNIETKITKTAGLLTYQTWDQKALRKGWYDDNKVDEFRQFGKDLLIWKMHSFVRTESSVDAAVAKARECKTLILDLRGNGGGYVDIEKRLLGYFFDKDIKIGDEKKRKETKPAFAKSRGSDVFKGDLILLVDHESASAAEIFARIVQLEKRGKVIGDKTSGSVMTSKFFPLDMGFGNNLYFGASITVGDFIMPDGKSLEKTGVVPDEILLPTGKDMAESKDPVLSYAAKLAGVNISPEQAGSFFPFEWPK
jgi:carboxyl-terminal processing protease